jgi:hypothetical protein
MVGVVKRAAGGGFDMKGRGGLRAGMPKADFKGEDMEAGGGGFGGARRGGLYFF